MIHRKLSISLSLSFFVYFSLCLSLQSVMLPVRAGRASVRTSQLLSCGERAFISHKHTSDCILRAFTDRYVGVCWWRGAYLEGFICKWLTGMPPSWKIEATESLYFTEHFPWSWSSKHITSTALFSLVLAECTLCSSRISLPGLLRLSHLVRVSVMWVMQTSITLITTWVMTVSFE